MSRDLVLDYLIRNPVVCVPVDSISPALDYDHDDVLDHLATLEVAGLVESWELDSNVSVSLTSLAARRAGLRISVDSTLWVQRGQRERPTRRKPSGTEVATDAGVDPDSVADARQVRPDLVAEIREEAGLHQARMRGDYLSRPLQVPSRFHGLTSTWPLPGHRADEGHRMPPQSVLGERDTGQVVRYVGPCAGCGTEAFGAADYCDVCDRSGQDHLIRKLPKEVQPDRTKPQAPAKFKPNGSGKGKKAG